MAGIAIDVAVEGVGRDLSREPTAVPLPDSDMEEEAERIPLISNFPPGGFVMTVDPAFTPAKGQDPLVYGTRSMLAYGPACFGIVIVSFAALEEWYNTTIDDPLRHTLHLLMFVWAGTATLMASQGTCALLEVQKEILRTWSDTAAQLYTFSTFDRARKYWLFILFVCVVAYWWWAAIAWSVAYTCQYPPPDLNGSRFFKFVDKNDGKHGCDPYGFLIAVYGPLIVLLLVAGASAVNAARWAYRTEASKVTVRMTSEELTCCVCLTSVRTADATAEGWVVLPCAHAGHAECFYTWMRGSGEDGWRNHNCPLCRTELPWSAQVMLPIEVQQWQRCVETWPFTSLAAFAALVQLITAAGELLAVTTPTTVAYCNRPLWFWLIGDGSRRGALALVRLGRCALSVNKSCMNPAWAAADAFLKVPGPGGEGMGLFICGMWYLAASGPGCGTMQSAALFAVGAVAVAHSIGTMLWMKHFHQSKRAVEMPSAFPMLGNHRACTFILAGLQQ